MITNRALVLNYFKENENGLIDGGMTIDSGISGTEILIVGGTHGDEPGGVNAIVDFHKYLIKNSKKLKSGKVHFLLGNPNAYALDCRYIDYDLNRVFDNTSLDNYESRRAMEILKFLDLNNGIVAVLDFHSVSVGDLQMIVYDIEHEKSSLLAFSLSPVAVHLAYHSKHIKGLLIGKCQDKGMMSFAVECGNHDDRNSSDVAYSHIKRSLFYFEIMDEDRSDNKSNDGINDDDIDNRVDTEFKNRKEFTRYETIASVIPGPNFKYSKKFVTGDYLKKGELIGKSDNGEHRSPEDCYFVLPSKNVRLDDCDVGFLCTKS